MDAESKSSVGAHRLAGGDSATSNEGNPRPLGLLRRTQPYLANNLRYSTAETRIESSKGDPHRNPPRNRWNVPCYGEMSEWSLGARIHHEHSNAND